MDLADVSTVAAWVQAARTRQLKPADPARYLCPGELAIWHKRWPLVNLYACPFPGCDDFVVGNAGYCQEHGGGRGAWAYGESGYLYLYIGKKYEAYHRLVVGCPPNMDVHHIDFNRLNNRYENLRIMTHADHWELHRVAMLKRPPSEHVASEEPAP